MKRKGLSTGCAGALVIALLIVSAWGQKEERKLKVNFANVIADAECMVDGADVLVSAMLEQGRKLGAGTYDVGVVTFTLEEKVLADIRFREVIGSPAKILVNDSFPEVGEGERVEVATHLYENICSSLPIDPTANALRAVVTIEVLNANPDRKGGLIHTGRCVSFPNPCR